MSVDDDNNLLTGDEFEDVLDRLSNDDDAASTLSLATRARSLSEAPRAPTSSMEASLAPVLSLQRRQEDVAGNDGAQEAEGGCG